MPARLAVLLFVFCLVIPSGCASALQRSIRAYERGDFRAAHELLARVDAPEGRAVRDAVAGGIEYSTSYLLSQAWVALERGRAKPYREAMAYYRAALAVMPDDHPRRAETIEAVKTLEADMAEVRERLHTEAFRFDTAARRRDYAAALGSADEIIALMRSVGGDDLDANEVLDLAEQAMADAEHDIAVQLVERADLLRREARTLEQADMSEIARVAAALRYFRRVEDGEAAPAVAVRPARKSASGGRPPSSSTSPVSSSPPEPESEPEVDEGEQVARREARAHLRRARAQWEAGNKFEALRILDEGLVMLGARPPLENQRRQWEPARELLIEDYVERGEMALSREASTEARGWYERILALDPTHELAHDRLRKLDKLEELKGSGDR